MKKIRIPYEYNAGDFLINQIKWPQLCPCCGNKPDENFYNLACRIDLNKFTSEPIPSYIKGRRFHSLQWQIPYCNICTSHARKTEILTIFIILTDIVLFALLIFYLIQTLRIAWIPLLALALFITDISISKVILPILLKPMLNESCVTHDYAILARPRKNHIQLRFKNDNYAHLFVQLNNFILE